MRIKVLVASGNPDLVSCLKTEAEFDKNKMQVLAWVDSGEEIFAQLDYDVPELIIVDSAIKGIETINCIEKIYSINEKCQVLVIGAKDDADLMYGLLKVKVWGYLSFPLNIQNFNAELKKLSENIRNITFPQIKYESCMAMRSLYFWELMFENSDVANDMNFVNQLIGTQFQEGLFRALLFRFDQLQKDVPDFRNTKFYSDLNPMQREVKKTVNDYIYEFCYDIISDFRFNGVLMILNYDQKNEKNILDTFEDIRSKVMEYTEQNYGIAVTLCVGGAYDDFTMIQQSREEAYSMAWFRMKKGTNKVIYWKDAHQIQDSHELKLTTIVEKLKLACDTLNYMDFEKSVDELFELPDYVLGNYKIREYILSFVEYFFEVNDGVLSQYMNVEEEKELVKKALNYSYTLDIFQQNLKGQLGKMFELLMIDMDKKNIRQLRKAVRYIKNNYDKTISAETLAQVANLSPVYFSHLFKKQTGMNMTDYITEYRMQIAREKLLETDLSIYEIAVSVGFREQRYFSKRFKQIVGMTPSEYRKMK